MRVPELVAVSVFGLRQIWRLVDGGLGRNGPLGAGLTNLRKVMPKA